MKRYTVIILWPNVVSNAIRLLQIEGHIQKHLQEKNHDIVAWLRRQTEYIKEFSNASADDSKSEL
jgi:hypothetical protein